MPVYYYKRTIIDGCQSVRVPYNPEFIAFAKAHGARLVNEWMFPANIPESLVDDVCYNIFGIWFDQIKPLVTVRITARFDLVGSDGSIYFKGRGILVTYKRTEHNDFVDPTPGNGCTFLSGKLYEAPGKRVALSEGTCVEVKYVPAFTAGLPDPHWDVEIVDPPNKP